MVYSDRTRQIDGVKHNALELDVCQSERSDRPRRIKKFIQ